MLVRYWWRQYIHSSFLVAWMSAVIVVGVCLSALTRDYFSGVGWLIIALLCVVVSFFYKRKWCIITIIIAGMLLGLWRGGGMQQQLMQTNELVGQQIVMSGVVAEDVTLGKHGDQQIIIKDIKVNKEMISGAAWVSTRTKLQIKRNDQVVVSGMIQKGFGSFSMSTGNAVITKAHTRTDIARDTRDWFAEGVRRVVQEPLASLGIGLLVGQRNSLPLELDTQLRAVGLTHIVVASGYNLTILVRIARRFFVRISKYLTVLAGSSLLFGFILITGFSPSMTRAGLVTGLSLLAWYYGRTFNPFVLLPLVAAVTVMINPFYAWGDIGWYLSFAAFTGVMIVAPILQEYFFGDKKKLNLLPQILVETTSAIIMTVPIILLAFGQYATYALPANILVVPLVPLAMLGIFIAGCVSLSVPAVAGMAALPAHYVLSYFTSIIQWCAGLPNATGELKVGMEFVVLYYGVLFGAWWYMWRVTSHSFLKRNIIE